MLLPLVAVVMLGLGAAGYYFLGRPTTGGDVIASNGANVDAATIAAGRKEVGRDLIVTLATVNPRCGLTRRPRK